MWLAVEVFDQALTYTLTIVEEASLTQEVEFSSAEMARLLDEQGFVAIRGILFDTGKAEIKPESEPILAQIAELLRANAELKLKIQGHTDNVGCRDDNLKLSGERARSVMTYLVERHQVASERLSAEGLGDTVPVADNRTEAGRAQNRRVELVKQ